MTKFFAKPIRRKHNAATTIFFDGMRSNLENTGQTIAKLTDQRGFEIVLNPGDQYELDSGFPTVNLSDIVQLSFIPSGVLPNELKEEKIYISEV